MAEEGFDFSSVLRGAGDLALGLGAGFGKNPQRRSIAAGLLSQSLSRQEREQARVEEREIRAAELTQQRMQTVATAENERLTALAEGLREQGVTLEQGMKSKAFSATFNAGIRSMVQAGMGTAESLISNFQAITQGGLSFEERKQIEADARRGGTQVVQVRTPEGLVRDVLIDKETGETIRVLGEGPDIGVSAATPEAAGLKTLARERAGEVAGAEAAMPGTASTVASGINILRQAKELGPGVSGLRQIVSQSGAGLLGQLNQSLGAGFSEFVAGASPEEIQTFRTEARAFVGGAIEQFSGEESGRFTEQERALAERAVRIVDDPTASFPQLKAAIETSIKLALMTGERERFQAGRDFRFDTTSDEGINLAGEELISLGFTRSSALEAIKALRTLQRELEAVRGDGG